MPKGATCVDSPLKVRRIWVAEGCIACGWCGDLLPTVFTKSADGLSQVRGGVRQDGETDDNDAARSLLRKAIKDTDADFVEFVAAGCPPHVIHLE